MFFNRKNLKNNGAPKTENKKKEPKIVTEKEEVKIKKEKDKTLKITNKKTEVLEDKKQDALSVGERTIKDFIATDVDRTDEDCMKIGNKYVSSFMINGYPSMVQVGWLDDLYNFNGDIDTALHIIPCDERNALDQLTAKITQFEAQLSIEIEKGNIRNTTRLKDQISSLYEERRALEQNYENLYYVEIVSNLYADSKADLKKQTQKLINKLKGRRINIDQMYLRQEDSYKSALPIGEIFIKDKLRNFNSGALSACFPFYNSEITHKNGVFIGINMSTVTPMFIDFYDRSILNNSNISVLGQAGQGKTFFVSLLTIRSALKGIRTVIVDPEGEYKEVADIGGGKTVRLSQDSDTFINPFDVEEEIDPDTKKKMVDLKSKVADLLNLIAVMVQSMSNEQMSCVSMVLLDTYKDFGITEDPNSLYEVGSKFDEKTGQLVYKQKKAMPTLSDFRANLNKYMNMSTMYKTLLSPIYNTLAMYCKGGVYTMFDHQTTSNLENLFEAPIINFDVSNLEENVLRPIGMYICMTWTWEKFIKKNPKIKKRIVCDEAWMLMNKNMKGHEFTAQFLENCARRIRKRNGGLLVASQNFVEFANNDQGKSVLTNTICNILLGQSTTDIDMVQDTFKLSDGERDFLLTAKRGEMLLKIGKESSIVLAYPFQYEYNLLARQKSKKDNFNDQ